MRFFYEIIAKNVLFFPSSSNESKKNGFINRILIIFISYCSAQGDIFGRSINRSATKYCCCFLLCNSRKKHINVTPFRVFLRHAISSSFASVYLIVGIIDLSVCMRKESWTPNLMVIDVRQTACNQMRQFILSLNAAIITGYRDPNDFVSLV